jgi:hypothetical protein
MTALRALSLALAALLVYALYLPSAYPPARFLEQMRLEHERNVGLWGAQQAGRILARSLALYGQREALAPAAFAATPSVPVTAENAALAQYMSAVVQRLLHNAYARGFDALLLLATYRLSVLVEWLPWLAAFVLLACFDGYLVRTIRNQEFLEHCPTRFALCVFAAALAFGLMLLLLVIPAALDPLALFAVPLALGGLLSRAISHFHP